MPFPFPHAAGRSRSLGLALVTLLLVLTSLSAARAADLTVLTAGAYKPVLLDLIADFQTRTGDRIDVSNDTAGGVAARIERGEDVDLVILPVAGLDSLTAKNRIVAGTAVKLAKSGIGVVVKAGMPKPDIGTVEAFKATLLAAPSIAYIDPAAGGSSGIYLAKLFERLGIADALKRKSVLVPGGLTASRVVNGEATLALQQISELRAVRDVLFVGPLPEEIQNYTIYAGAIPTSSRKQEAAKALLAYLHGEAAMKTLTARGLEKP